MEVNCYFCGHSETEHLGGEYECQRDGCACIEFTPPPDPKFRFRMTIGESCGE